MSQNQCELQQELIPHINDIRNSITGLHENEISSNLIYASAFSQIYYLFTFETPPVGYEKNPLVDLIKDTVDTLIPYVQQTMKDLNDSIDVDAGSYTMFSDFIEQNISKLAYINVALVRIKDQDSSKMVIQQIESLTAYLENLIDKIKIIKENEEVIYAYTPKQYCTLVAGKIPELLSIFEKLPSEPALSDQKYKTIITDFFEFINDLQSLLLNSIDSNDYILELVEIIKLVEYRRKIAELCFFSGAIDKSISTQITKTIFEILCYFDHLIQYRLSMPSNETTPLDVSRSAAMFQAAIQAILEVPTVEPILPDQLSSLEAFMSLLAAAYEETISLKSTTNELLKLFDECFEDFEYTFQRLISAKFAKQTVSLIYDFYFMKTALKNISYKDSDISSIDPGIVMSHELTVQKDLKNSTIAVISNFVTEPVELELPTLIPLFMNPSRKAFTLQKQSKVEELIKYEENKKIELLNKCQSSLESLSESIQSIAINDKKALPQLKKISKDLFKDNLIVEMYRKTDNLSQEFEILPLKLHDVTKLFNLLLESMNKKLCVQPESYTPFFAVKIVVALLSQLVKEIELTINKKEDLKEIGNNVIEQANNYLKQYQILMKTYSDSLLISMKEMLVSSNEYFTEFKDNCKTFDHVSRECYLRNLLAHLIPAISVLTNFAEKFEQQTTDVLEVVMTLNDADGCFHEILQSLLLNLQSIRNSYVALFIISAISQLSMIRGAIVSEDPSELLKPLINIRQQLEEFPRLIKFIDPSLNSILPLNLISLARWKLNHLDHFYSYDAELAESLKQVLQYVNEAINNVHEKQALQKIASVIKPIYETLGKFTERDGSEPTEYKKKFSKCIVDLEKAWVYPFTHEAKEAITQARIQLNNSILILNGEEVALTELRESQTVLSSFVETVINNVTDRVKYYHHQGAAEFRFVVKRDINILRDQAETLEKYLNTTTSTTEEFKQTILTNVLYLLSAANQLKSKTFEEIKEIAQNLYSMEEAKFIDSCFNLDSYYHMLIEEALRRKESDAKIERQLFVIFSEPKQETSLALAVYYSELYSSRKKLDVFSEIGKKLRECGHGAGDMTKVDFKAALEIIGTTVPVEVQQTEIPSQEAFDEIIKQEPIGVVPKEKPFNCDKDTHPEFYYFNNWTLHSLIPSDVKFELQEIDPIIHEPLKISINNEVNLPENDSKGQNYIHTPIISSQLHYLTDSEKPTCFEFNELGKIIKNSYEPKKITPFMIDKDPSMPKKTKYVSFKFDSLLIENKPIELLSAIVYVLDNSTGKIVTDIAIYDIDGGKAKLQNSTSTEVLFEVPESSEHLYLVCRLFHSQSIDTSSFVSYILTGKNAPAPSKTPFNFAVTAAPLFGGNEYFYSPKTFTEKFHLCYTDPGYLNNTKLVSTIQAKEKQNTFPSVLVKSQFETAIVEDLPSEFSYSWSNTHKDTFVAPIINTSQYSTTPIITLSDLTFRFKKPPKGQFTFFTAYYAPNDSSLKSISGLNNILSYESPSLQQKYTSSTLPIAAELYFPDMVRFVINQKVSEKTNIVIQLNIINKGQPAEVYKVSVIPLYTESKPIRDENVDIPLFEASKAPKDYIGLLKKQNPHSRTTGRITIPIVYIPYATLLPLQDIKTGVQIPEGIVFKQIPKEYYIDSYIPILSRFVHIISCNTIPLFIEFLANDEEMMNNIARKWILNAFNSTRYISYTKQFLSEFSNYTSMVVKAEPSATSVLNVIQLVRCSAIFIDIALVSLLRTPIDDKIINEVNKFCEAILHLMCLASTIKMTDKLNETYAEFLYVIAPRMQVKDSLNLIEQYLNRVQLSLIMPFNLEPLFPPPPENPKKNKPPPEPPISRPEETSSPMNIRVLELRYQFLHIFAKNQALLARIAQKDEGSNIFEQMFASLTDATALNLHPQWIELICEFVIHNEDYPSIAPFCADIFIPYLKYAIKHFNYYKQDTDLFKKFLSPILYIIHTAHQEKICAFYEGLGDEERSKYIEFLEQLLIHVLSPIGEAETFDITDGVINRTEETKKYEEIKAKAESYDFTLFIEFSVRILGFTESLIEHVRLDEKSIEKLTSLLIQQINIYQHVGNFPDIMLVLSKHIDAYAHYFFFNHVDAYSMIILAALKLIHRKMRVSRAAGTAIIIHLLYIDFLTTENVLVTMHYLFDNYITTLLASPAFKLPLLKMVSDKIKLFVNSFPLESFQRACAERFEAIKVIYDTCDELKQGSKSPEFQVSRYRTIANKFYEYPILRLKFLQKIVDINTQYSLDAQSFASEMQIASLINQMIVLNKEEDFPHLDFSIISETEEEKKISIDRPADATRHLVSKHKLFNSDGILEVLEKAIEYGKKANLRWHIRSVLFFLMAIKEARRDVAELIKVSHDLTTLYEEIEHSNKSPLSFYLVEIRRKGETISQNVYSSVYSTPEEFCKFLNDKEQSRFEFAETALPYKSAEIAAKEVTDGVCVSQVYSTNNLAFSNYADEFVQETYTDEKGWTGTVEKRFIIKTVAPHPCSCISVPVKSTETNELNKIQTIKLNYQIQVDNIKESKFLMNGTIPPEPLFENWKKYSPAPGVCALIISLSDALLSEHCIGNDLIDATKSPGQYKTELIKMNEEFVSEIQSSISLLEWAYKNTSIATVEEANGEIFETIYEKLKDASKKYIKATTKKDLQIMSISMKPDPISFKRDYEDF